MISSTSSTTSPENPQSSWDGAPGRGCHGTDSTHPDQVSAAVLIEPTFHLPRAAPFDALRLLLPTKLDFIRSRDRAAAKTMARFVYARRSGGNGWDELDDPQRGWFLGDADGLRAEFKVLERFSTSVDHISAKEVAGWSVPITYVLGKDSAPWVHAVHGTPTKAAPQIRTSRVPDACHLLPLQPPEAVVHAVRSLFLIESGDSNDISGGAYHRSKRPAHNARDQMREPAESSAR